MFSVLSSEFSSEFSSEPEVASAKNLLTSTLLLGGALLITSPAVGQDTFEPPSPPGTSNAPGIVNIDSQINGVEVLGAFQPRLRSLSPQLKTEPETASLPPYRHRWDAFRGELVGPVLAAGAVQGTLMHLAGHPDRWGQDAGGYLARVGSGVGVQLVNRGVHHGLAAALNLRLETPDPQQGSLEARMGQAALQAVTTRTASGRRVPAAGSLSGSYAAILTQRRLTSGQWKPGQAAIGTAIGVGIEAVWAAGSELARTL
ncbi:hypothetical protein [Salinibacter altiplanensis]|uniref:hypothetical protein n=1 Tax=Salinibacter altiplanensis TaxID=1803181 RepID=UPI000C9F2F32|nr:hypothetical protein [Salinibacter altiplanensis]